MRALVLLLCVVVVAVAGCQISFDCAQCHVCRNGVCTAAADYTDPNDECPERCGVPTVCGPLHICVFQRRPTCNCDWMEGVCVDEPVAVVVPTVDELHRKGLSDVDVTELMALMREEHRRLLREAHKDHEHILTIDEASAHDIIFIQNTMMFMVSLAVIIIAGACIYRRLLDQEISHVIKSQ